MNKAAPGQARQLKCQLRLHRIVILHFKVIDRNILKTAALFLVKNEERMLCVICHDFCAAQHFLRVVHVAVIDLLVGDEMCEDAGFISRHFRDHHKKRRVLDLVDTARAGGCEHISAALDHAHIQIFSADIPHGQKSAGSEAFGFVKISFLPEGNYFSSAVRIFFDIIDQVMDQVIALDSGAIALADRAVADIPRIPPGDAQFPHLGKDICRVLVDGKDLADAGFPGLTAQRADGELTFAQVVFAHDMVDADGVGGRSVLISGTGIYIFVAVIENIVDVLYKELICFGHISSFLSRKMRIKYNLNYYSTNKTEENR